MEEHLKQKEMNKQVELHFEQDKLMKAKKREEMAAIAKRQYQETKEAMEQKLKQEKMEALKFNQ